MSFKAAARIVFALAAIGLGRELWFHVVVERIWALPEEAARSVRPDDRYAVVRALLPRKGRIGYLTDEPLSFRPGSPPTHGNERYEEALYALAPLILRYGDADQPVVLVDAADPVNVEGLCSAYRLAIQVRPAAGMAVARRVPK